MARYVDYLEKIGPYKAIKLKKAASHIGIPLEDSDHSCFYRFDLEQGVWEWLSHYGRHYPCWVKAFIFAYEEA